MKFKTSDERSNYVKEMFSRIAQRYDLMNRIMTGFQDIRWRRIVIQRAQLEANSILLDLGTGTGDLAREALRQHPTANVMAADFTIEMMRVGATRDIPLNWLAADALHTPFPGATLDAVVSGFLMRNVTDLEKALSEQFHILKEGGRIVILDTTRPSRNILRPFIWVHMHIIIPFLGRVLTGAKDAYKYLPDTTENFVTAETMSALLTKTGFGNVGFSRYMFGTIAIHRAVNITGVKV